MRKLSFLALNVAGVAALLLPFVIAARPVTSPSQARSADAPWLMALLVPLLVGMAVAEAMSGRMNSRALALLGILAGTSALLRLPISFAGGNLFFFLPIVAGFVFGPSFGFLLGALGMAASAVVTGGIGPWLPFQMWAAGWVGAGAGCLGLLGRSLRPRLGATVLVVYGYFAAFFFGAVMNLYFWPVVASGDAAIGWRPGLGLATTLSHYRSFYLLTSVAWDAVGGIMNMVLILVLGIPVIELFRRYRSRFSFEIREIPSHVEAVPVPGQHPQGSDREPVPVTFRGVPSHR